MMLDDTQNFGDLFKGKFDQETIGYPHVLTPHIHLYPVDFPTNSGNLRTKKKTMVIFHCQSATKKNQPEVGIQSVNNY